MLLLLLSGCVGASRPSFEYQAQVGVASLISGAGVPCLTIPVDGLMPGTRLILADPIEPAVTRGVMVAQAQESCPGVIPGPEDRFYVLELESATRPQPGRVWFALLVEDGVLSASPEGVVGDLDRDGEGEQFRVCTSTEGLHLTIWSGAPLVGPRRWHRYFYLGYDVEPSCTPKDFEGT